MTIHSSVIRITVSELKSASYDELVIWQEEERRQMDTSSIHRENYNNICRELKLRDKYNQRRY